MGGGGGGQCFESCGPAVTAEYPRPAVPGRRLHGSVSKYKQTIVSSFRLD